MPYLFRVREEELPYFSVVTEMSKPESAGFLEVMTSVTAYMDEAEPEPGAFDGLNFMWGFGVVVSGLVRVLRIRGSRVPRLPLDSDTQAYYGSLVTQFGSRERRERIHELLVNYELPLLQAIARVQEVETKPNTASFEAGLIGGYAVMSEAVALRLCTDKIRWD